MNVIRQLRPASMEPRPFERGNTKTQGRFYQRKKKLQWSHVLSNVETADVIAGIVPSPRRFNGATSFRTWKRLCLALLASARSASMEPRPFERGNNAEWPTRPQFGRKCFNGATSFRTWKLSFRPSPIPGKGASMEPRPFERGNWDVLISLAKDYPLQWSHVLSNVETTSGRRCRCARRRCFNGATSFRTWKLDLVPQGIKQPGWLQWSHVLSNVETRSGVAFHPHWKDCFNGATSFRTWKPVAEISKLIDKLSFNGATSFRTWKHVAAVNAVIRLPASMEPRPFERGNGIDNRGKQT